MITLILQTSWCFWLEGICKIYKSIKSYIKLIEESEKIENSFFLLGYSWHLLANVWYTPLQPIKIGTLPALLNDLKTYDILKLALFNECVVTNYTILKKHLTLINIKTTTCPDSQLDLSNNQVRFVWAINDPLVSSFKLGWFLPVFFPRVNYWSI